MPHGRTSAITHEAHVPHRTANLLSQGQGVGHKKIFLENFPILFSM